MASQRNPKRPRDEDSSSDSEERAKRSKNEAVQINTIAELIAAIKSADTALLRNQKEIAELARLLPRLNQLLGLRDTGELSPRSPSSDGELISRNKSSMFRPFPGAPQPLQGNPPIAHSVKVPDPTIEDVRMAFSGTSASSDSSASSSQLPSPSFS